ncbi:NAD(P)-binding protein [Periconia macrospinosa]|uniref:NAD(P)-binding protein n=1 Tax=Periconia macrospinosa TaxID=97972 RepID=A0A2V1E4H7_9PLEO|nr:NAD(P)-binding protein [Periconia macrospinosa]
MTIDDRGLLAITGANGTIGYASVLYALHVGYRVRCIVRREDVVETIKAGPSIQQYAGKVQYAVVPDNTVPGAYDTAFEGATKVLHVAGVWPKPNYHPDNEIYYPYVKSTENIISAAQKSGSVRRVVITQAGAGLISPDDGDTLGTAMNKVLNEFVPVNSHSASIQPPIPTPHHSYSAAKAYCMKYLHSLRSSKKLPFSIIQIIPGTVIGPSELVSTAADASARMDRMSRALLFNDPKPRYAFGFINVEDCAKVHVEALDEKKVSGDEAPPWFIAAAESVQGKSGQDLWKEAGDYVEDQLSDGIDKGLFTIGRDNVPLNMPFYVDSSLTRKMLMEGQGFKGFAQSVVEVGRWYTRLSEHT